MKTIRYAKRLIEFNSTSALSNRMVSKYLEMKLTKHGFVVEKIPYRDANDVRKVNLVAKKGQGQGGLAYFGHTDVVPAETWQSSVFGPFQPRVIQERLYGRGSCDMKGSIAAMLSASQMFDSHQLKHPLYFVCTADEEVGFHGARRVVESSEYYREMVRHGTKAIIGEPTGLEVVHAHKGSCRVVVTGLGKAAHSSTRNGQNANLAMIPFLNQLLSIYEETERDPQWQNSQFDPPTMTWNILIKDNAAALNITPSRSTCSIYARPMPNVPIDGLLDRVKNVAQMHGLQIVIDKACDPLFTASDSEFVQQVLRLTHRSQAKTVSYATDGGVLSELPDKLILGPGNIAQAHTDDEWISLEQLTRGTELYARLIQHFCCEE